MTTGCTTVCGLPESGYHVHYITQWTQAAGMSEITDFKGKAVEAVPADDTDALVAMLMRRVGERVRKARELKGIPRRVLSDMSGVSPRYLAQLEAGEGNISIGLLQKVAFALDHRIEWFMSDEDPWTSDVHHFARLYRRANADLRARVRDLLAPDTPGGKRANRVALVGLRGAGKSTLGAKAAQALAIPFLELNREIEEQSGMPINELLAFYGQEGYRRLEAQALERVIATHDTMILAVAGGVVADPDVYNTLLANFHTIWLRATPEDHMERVRAQGDTRPMAGNPEAMDQLRSILTSREALYARALAELDTSGKTLDTSRDDLVALIREKGFLG